MAMKVFVFRICQTNFPYIKKYIEGEAEKIETIIYVTALPLRILAEKCKIDRWTPANRDGYQRAPSEYRIAREMIKYLFGEVGSYPTSILVNIRGNSCKFEKIDEMYGIEYGYLEIPDNETFYLIDGQHRIESLKRALGIIRSFDPKLATEIENYPLPVSIMNVDRFMEMLHFYIVNSRQRRVPTDLAFKLIQQMLRKGGAKIARNIVGEAHEWKGRSVTIVDILNEDTRSPWYRRIQYLGEEKEEHHIIRDSVFSRSLQYILKEATFRDLDDMTIAQYLMDYWRAIFELYPEVLENPKRYTLISFTGINAFHMLFPVIYYKSIN